MLSFLYICFWFLSHIQGVTIQADERLEVSVVPFQYQGTFIKPVVKVETTFCETVLIDEYALVYFFLSRMSTSSHPRCLVNKKIRSKGKILRVSHADTNGDRSHVDTALAGNEISTETIARMLLRGNFIFYCNFLIN
jgi:hypothetical protein